MHNNTITVTYIYRTGDHGYRKFDPSNVEVHGCFDTVNYTLIPMSNISHATMNVFVLYKNCTSFWCVRSKRKGSRNKSLSFHFSNPQLSLVGGR